MDSSDVAHKTDASDGLFLVIPCSFVLIVLIQRSMEQAWNAKHVIIREYSDSAEQPLLFSDDFMLIFVHCSLKANCFLVSCFGDHVRRGLTNTAILQLIFAFCRVITAVLLAVALGRELNVLTISSNSKQKHQQHHTSRTHQHHMTA